MVCDYLLPEGMTLAAAGKVLGERLEVRDGHTCVGDRAYYDTFDGRLRAAGRLAVWEDGSLELIEIAADRTLAGAPVAKPRRPLFAGELPEGPLRGALTPLLADRALLPLIEIHCRERLFDVLDREHKTVVRMRLQQPALGRRRLRPRIHVAAVRGYDKALRRVGQTLTAELGFEQSQEALVDEAVVLSGARPGGTSGRIAVSFEPRQDAGAAAAAVLRRLLGVAEANMEGAVADVDSEFLHDLRVSVRRTRAVQRELRHVFEPTELERFRDDFRWLQQVTGDARDLDVYLLEFEQMRALVPAALRPDLDALRAVLARRRAGARRRMVRALRSERTASLLADWSAFLGRLERNESGGPDAGRPIGEVAGERIAKVYARMVRTGDAIGLASVAGDYHELRKKGKELRYLLELFGAQLFPAEVVKPMIKSLKALQDVLGRYQDREVQAATLRSLSGAVASASEGPAALMAMGVLVERLEEDQLAARDQFADTFATFASRRQRKLVRETFA
ncbi:MAG TPA: CHAD domain-containing protein [Solirubrobacteraceae bacterium]|jgi:CHAD domain-containing protein